MNLARLCAHLKPVFLSKKGPSKARLLTKMSPSEELGTLQLLHHSAGGGYGMTSVLWCHDLLRVCLAWLTCNTSVDAEYQIPPGPASISQRQLTLEKWFVNNNNSVCTLYTLMWQLMWMKSVAAQLKSHLWEPDKIRRRCRTADIS